MPTMTRYHHGNLRPALLREAEQLIRDDGVEGLSLRRLAERAGVSRAAPYHHFEDKNALLCALAGRGFADLTALIEGAELGPAGDPEPGLRRFVRDYLRFATDDPERYELMFGRTIWKIGRPTSELRAVAYDCFQRYVDRIVALLGAGARQSGSRPLRLAQASWATLHGLCRLLIDGIYVDPEDIVEVSDEAVRLLVASER